MEGMGVACGNCGGNVLMATCDMFRGTGHEWVIVSVCMVCRAVHWTDDGCLDCKEAESGQPDGPPVRCTSCGTERPQSVIDCPLCDVPRGHVHGGRGASPRTDQTTEDR